jgi:hypothetical protein
VKDLAIAELSRGGHFTSRFFEQVSQRTRGAAFTGTWRG